MKQGKYSRYRVKAGRLTHNRRLYRRGSEVLLTPEEAEGIACVEPVEPPAEPEPVDPPKPPPAPPRPAEPKPEPPKPVAPPRRHG